MAKRQKPEIVHRGLSRAATYRLAPEVAQELELHVRVRELGGLEHSTHTAIVQEGLRLFYQRHPIPKEKRKALDVLMELER